MNGPEADGASTRALATIAGIIVAVEALIVLLILRQASVAPIGGDAAFYEVMANNLVHGHGLSTSTAAPFEPAVWRSPGYPAFLAGLKLLGLGAPLPVRIVQFVLLAATAVITGKTAKRLAGPRVARIATVLVATTIPLVWAATWHMSENLSALTLSAAVYLVVRARADEAWSMRLLAAAGIAFAVSIYVRPTLLALAPVFAVAITLDARGGKGLARALPAACLVSVCAIAIVPWTVRNFVHTHEVIPVETGRGPTLLVSAHQYAGDLGVTGTAGDYAALVKVTRDASRPYRAEGFSPRDQVAADKAAAAAAPWDRVTARGVAAQVPQRLLVMLGPIDTQPPNVSAARLLQRTAWAQGLICLFLALAGLVVAPQVWRLWPVWIPPASVALMHLLMHVEPRYSIPHRPEFMVLAALGFAAATDAVRRRAWAPAPGA